MKKKSTRMLALLAFLVTIGAVGAMQYFNLTKAQKGEAAEDAADAVGAAANAALDWTKDKTERTVEVVTMVGQVPQVVTIRTQLTMLGASKLSEVCASLPRVRDAINGMLFDQVSLGLHNGRRVDLAGFEAPLKARLNTGYAKPAIERIRLSLGNAAVDDAGCTEHPGERTAHGEGAQAPHQASH